MLNVCEPCLMVITRAPRRCSSAQSFTVSVVLPLFFLPITATIGGRGMSLREDAFLWRVDVHEQKGRVAEPRNLRRRDARETHVVVECDHAAVTERDAPFDGRGARRSVVRAQGLEPASRVTLRNHGIDVSAA